MEERKLDKDFFPSPPQLLKHPLAIIALVPKDAALFLAGAIADAAAKTVTAPLDCIKILMQEFEMFENESMYVASKSELELYLDEPKVKFGQGEDFDVLSYWRHNESRFPTLSFMARDVLSIPITTVASESAFSIGGRVLTKYRSSTLPENLQMLICTRNWLHGFTLNPDDEDDCKIIHHEALTAESQGASRISN